MNSTSSPKNGLPSCSAEWRWAVSSLRTMCFRATMRSPLRSKRAMISPVRPRANASGLTRMRVRSIRGGLLRVLLRRRLERRRRLGLELELVRPARAAAAPAAARRGRDARDLRLAVRADAPRRVQRLRAVHARVLELAHAARAAQELALHLGVAVRAQEVVQRV